MAAYEKSSMSEFENVSEKYPDGLLFPVRLWSAHLMDTLLSHEATGEELDGSGSP